VLSSRFAVAVHVLSLLALEESGEPVTSDYVAGSVKTNPVVVRRILGLLRRAGLVRIQPGPRGGARLARPASKILLADVYHAVEDGQLLSLHRNAPNPRCPVGRHIGSVLGRVFGEAEAALEATLRRRTLGDVVGSVRECVAKEA
jgi:Rrf2 family protein